MKHLLFMTAMLFSPALALAGENPSWQISLRAGAIPEHPVLRDVADPVGTSAEILQRYGYLPIEGASVNARPQPSQVMAALSRAGVDLSRVWIRESGLKSQASSERSAVIAQVEKAVVKKAVQLWQVDPADVTVSFESIPDALPQKDSFDGVSVEFEKTNDVSRPTAKNIKAAFWNQNRTTQSQDAVTFIADLKVLFPVLVPNRSFPAGTTVTPDLFREEKRVVNEPGAYFRRVADLSGAGKNDGVIWNVVRALEIDTPVRRDDLQSPVSLQKGSLVTLIARSQRLQVRALGRVRETLGGGSVSVENLDSKKIVVGRPLNSSEVEIVF